MSELCHIFKYLLPVSSL